MSNAVNACIENRKAKGGSRVFHINTAQAEYQWKVLKKDTGITDKDFTIHTLRHTFASRLVQAGIDIYKVKDLLGHKSLKMTERYAHLAVHNYKDAIQMLNQLG